MTMSSQDTSLNLLELVYGLVEKLLLTVDYHREELTDLIESVQDNLAEIKSNYEKPAPRGAEGVQSLMVEALSLFDGAFQGILDFMDDEDEAYLKNSVSLAEEGNDLLGAIEEVIQQNKDIISEMIEA